MERYILFSCFTCSISKCKAYTLARQTKINNSKPKQKQMRTPTQICLSLILTTTKCVRGTCFLQKHGDAARLLPNGQLVSGQRLSHDKGISSQFDCIRRLPALESMNKPATKQKADTENGRNSMRAGEFDARRAGECEQLIESDLYIVY